MHYCAHNERLHFHLTYLHFHCQSYSTQAISHDALCTMLMGDEYTTVDLKFVGQYTGESYTVIALRYHANDQRQKHVLGPRRLEFEKTEPGMDEASPSGPLAGNFYSGVQRGSVDEECRSSLGISISSCWPYTILRVYSLMDTSGVCQGSPGYVQYLL